MKQTVTLTRARPGQGRQTQLPFKIRMTHPQRVLVYFFFPRGHKAEFFPEAPAFCFCESVSSGKGEAPGPARAMQREATTETSWVSAAWYDTLTQPERCTLRSWAGPDPAARAAATNLRVCTYKPSVCCEERLHKQSSTSLGRTKNRKKIRHEAAFTHNITISPRAGGSGSERASARARRAQSLQQGHSTARGETRALAAGFNAKLWSNRSGAGAEGDHSGTAER